MLIFPSISKARKARALDIWESLKPDVEQEMARRGVEQEMADMYAICFKGLGTSCFFVSNSLQPFDLSQQ